MRHIVANIIFIEVQIRGLKASELKLGTEIEAETAKLKRMYADLALENAFVFFSTCSGCLTLVRKWRFMCSSSDLI